jgi:choline-sulfatase
MAQLEYFQGLGKTAVLRTEQEEQMKMRKLMGVLGLSAMVSLGVQAADNVLLIITDQQTISAMSCAGNPYVKTPNMDALAARGVRFERSYSSNPQCCPARTSFFTSRRPHELGVFANANAALSTKGVPTLGELFQAHGYEAAYAGKWHLQIPYPAYKNKPIPGFDVLPLAGADPGDVDLGKEGKGLTADPNAADAAIRFLQQKHDKPFLLVASLLNPHDICEYGGADCEELVKMLPQDPDQLPPLRPNLKDTEPLPSAMKKCVETRSDLEWRQYLWIYYHLVETVDAEIGRILAALEQTGREKDTVVVFTSDHGEMMGSHSMRVKFKLYEESVAVPFVIATPESAGRVDSQHLISTLDVMPTLLDYAGIARPASLEGRSLRPLVEQRPVEWRDFVVSEVGNAFQARMVCTDRYKYIFYHNSTPNEQFFDLVKDPGELKNQVNNPEFLTEVEKHRALLKGWMEETKDVFIEQKKGSGKNRSSASGKKKTKQNAE